MAILLGDDVDNDYIVVNPSATKGKFNVVIMTYVKSSDGYEVKRISDPLTMSVAAAVARSWATVLHLEVRNNVYVDATVAEINEIDIRYALFADSEQPLIRELFGALAGHSANQQSRALALVAGMFLGEVDGMANDAEVEGGQLITYADRCRIFDTLRYKAYEWTMQERAKRTMPLGSVN